MRALVTGGAGFLGSHLVDLLVKNDAEVVVVDNFATGDPRNLAHLAGDPRLTVVERDACCSLLELPGPFRFVFHLASPASPVDFPRSPIEILRVNSVGTERALELARRDGATFLLASTSEIYGDPLTSPQRESDWGNVNSIGPRSCYDEGKRFAEAITTAYRRAHGVETRIVRFFNTYGPRMRLDDGRVVPNMIRQALAGEPLTIYGDGKQTRSFGFYEDVLDGVWRLANSDYAEPVNIGSTDELTILEFAEAVKAATGARSAIEHLPGQVDDPRQRKPDLARAREQLGWAPTTGLADGLAKTVAYFRAQAAS